ncbi:hypothetical protein HanRHA438_Chr14g0663871 [Helianthus annuus]|nr:hypothetical protein HanRHA438_Chr14g0663871 [Helianthus annuus]
MMVDNNSYRVCLRFNVFFCSPMSYFFFASARIPTPPQLVDIFIMNRYEWVLMLKIVWSWIMSDDGLVSG